MADPTPPKGGLWARLFGVNQSKKPDADSEPRKEDTPVIDGNATPAAGAEPAANNAPAANATPEPAAEPAPAAVATAEEPAAEEVAAANAEERKAPELQPPSPTPEAPREPVKPANAEPAPAASAAPVPPARPAAPAPAARPAVPAAQAAAKPQPAPAPAAPVAKPQAAAATATRAAPAPAAKPQPAPAAPAAQASQDCPVCGTKRKDGQPYCHDCGYMFGTETRSAGAPAAMSSPSASVPAGRVKDRYELLEILSERPGVTRFRGHDHETGQAVVIVRGAIPEMAEALLLEDEASPAEVQEDDFMPSFDSPVPVAQVEPAAAAAGPVWPSVAWELALLEKARHPALPAVLDNFADGSFEYLVEDLPQGRILWDAWDDPDNDSAVRYGWLMQIAEGLHSLHQAGAMVEGVRPDIITVTDAGQIMLSDLTDLLPIPVPPGTPIRATLYTAPELILSPDQADARADLYSFGAMVYSLEYLHHALEEKDFERQFSPRLITDRYPDVHPAFFRLVCKTFTRDLNTRFPTDEASKTDKSGFTELINTLDVCRRSFDNCRLDIAAWTTTGMVRTGNEDAFGLMQAVESRQDELTEYSIVLLADGMGGYEAGEVAAAMCIASLRTYLLQQPMFSAVAGKEAPAAGVFEPEACKKIMEAALKHANKEVYTASRTPGKGRRGMGCTAEAVYVDSRNLVVGHVGDSRTYHMSNGRLKQLTRDQTFVNRMVELGQLTEEEAEEHPRKNELQQAIGGQPDVVPGLYSAKLHRGDWVLVCSDGLTNHVPTADLEKMLRETYGSAEETARRLLNLVNLRGATDNATVVVIRAV